MDYHVALAPDLGLSAQDFIAVWNGAPECHALAEARVMPEPARGFPLDPQLVRQGLVLLAGAAGGLALEVLKEVVKEKLTEYLRDRPSRRPSITVESIRQPDGAYLLVVTEGET